MHANRQSEFINIGMIWRISVAFTNQFFEYSGATHGDD